MRTRGSRRLARPFFKAPDREEAEHLLEKFLARYETIAPALVRWAGEAIPESFTVFGLPANHRRRVRTTNPVERLNEEIPEKIVEIPYLFLELNKYRFFDEFFGDKFDYCLQH